MKIGDTQADDTVAKPSKIKACCSLQTCKNC